MAICRRPITLPNSCVEGTPGLGIALIALSGACWPGPPLLGMLIYSAAVTLYLVWLGFAGGFTGILLWPAVGLHVILTGLLTWELSSSPKDILH